MRVAPKTLLRAAKLPALLVSDVVNIRYLTGESFSLARLLVHGSKATLFLDGRYYEGAKHVETTVLRVRPLTQFPEALQKLRRVGLDSVKTTIEEESFMKKKYKNTKFVHYHGVIESFRRTKQGDELKAFRTSQRITRRIMAAVPQWLKLGVREVDIAWNIREAAHKAGAEGLSFDPIVAFGTHTSLPHHSPTTRKLKRDDIVQIDCGVLYHGYCSDQSAVFFTGTPTAKQRKTLVLLKRVMRHCSALAKAGTPPSSLDKVARSMLAKHDLESFFIHSLGHGVGLEIHEAPSVSRRSKEGPLRKGEIITIEPGVYFPGEWGMRVEQEVIVS